MYMEYYEFYILVPEKEEVDSFYGEKIITKQ